MKKGEQLFCGILIALSVLFLLGALKITPLSEFSLTSPGGYPVFIACLGLLFALWIAMESRKKGPAQEENTKPVLHKDVLAMTGLLVLYLITIIYLHYTISTLLFTLLSIYYLSCKWKAGLLVSYISTFMILFIFKYLFSVILP